jgi:BirA family transcriptional regulator, biotin operon repressor / biotin---[acetyl-CoA-carboxylase] ligase
MNHFIFQEILFSYDVIDSTNEEAKRLIKQNKGGLCFTVLSKTQTHGKGRMQREWVSSCDKNIYLTIAINNQLCLDIADIMPLYVAFAVIKTIGKKAQYKWVNDIIIEEKKVCGILIEKINDFFIIGIGVNLQNNPHNTVFPAGNLKEFGITITPEQIFTNFQNNVEIGRHFILNTLKQNFFTTKKITINQGEFCGYFYNINDAGNLILKQENGTLKEICFGDVGISL